MCWLSRGRETRERSPVLELGSRSSSTAPARRSALPGEQPSCGRSRRVAARCRRHASRIAGLFACCCSRPPARAARWSSTLRAAGRHARIGARPGRQSTESASVQSSPAAVRISPRTRTTRPCPSVTRPMIVSGCRRARAGAHRDSRVTKERSPAPEAAHEVVSSSSSDWNPPCMMRPSRSSPRAA